ncbi:polymer-forming cytoskeletal protein [Hyphomicrobium sp.]|uniref:bactofilin family protein n=1 Tax=Hyphomicrobium sp. TaxID=82 RepID=UPI000FC34FED|nr:polymer-forming cytoskeletal protein [Hyphomicrobium sp.]RUP00649.1 MAG: polymer-forming cytoskeletal protein [Hyphomicrobium sp.]
MHELKPAASIGRTLSIPRTATIEGGIDYPGPLVVEGTVLGDVNCLSLVVAERGIVEGTIKSETVTVAGEVSGEIFANELILKAACSVNAEIVHKKLLLESGAFFEGKSRRHASPLQLV